MPALACFALLALAPPALATFHEMSIREVYPGGANDASYVELQMWTGGQNFVGTHHLVAYNPDGGVNEDFALPSNVASGANQATILIADTGYPVVFDEKPAPDASDANLNLSPAGGAVCWIEGSPPDCVAWGDFTGPLPTHFPALKVGNPASPAGVTAGKALRRSIAKGCPGLLEPTDDSDDSATDFAEVEPQPRNNATTPIEGECPDTAIGAKPSNPTKSTTATFTYSATPAVGAEFECELDGAPFSSCETGGIEYTGLAAGSHTFEVRAVNAAGEDQTPAGYAWTVDLTPPIAKITAHPTDNSPGENASFKYESNELGPLAGATFECRLAPLESGFTSCAATGKTYLDLIDGKYSFEVRANDRAGNQSAPASFEWTVENPPGSTPPEPKTEPTPPPAPPVPPPASPPPPPSPDMTIKVRAPSTTHDRTPTFRFDTPAPGASFQCKLDRGRFRACRSPFTAKVLAFGRHTLTIRAIFAGSAGASPAVLHFKVVRR